MRRVLIALGVVGLVAVLAIGLSQAGRDEPRAKARAFDLDTALAQLEGAPPPLASLHEQSGELLGGGVGAMQKRLEELRGTPVVINKWASWCGPCRSEFPVFQEVSTSHGKEVAFLGLNSFDNQGDAREFLDDFPVPYPSYEDPDEKVAKAIRAPANFPITVFVGRDGKRAFVRQGDYASAEQLEADIERYLDA